MNSTSDNTERSNSELANEAVNLLNSAGADVDCTFLLSDCIKLVLMIKPSNGYLKDKKNGLIKDLQRAKSSKRWETINGIISEAQWEIENISD